jgi:hypothetical protein
MKNAANRKIFISYRVQDTAGETGRLVDALKQYFADDQLFMDIENLEPGADFVDSIEHSLDCCDVFLAVIGPQWIGDRGGGDIRINDPHDWVRTEVSTALQRNIRVVPVLVDGGSLPPADQLPPDLQPLLRRQAIEISNKRWRYDTDQLIKFLVQKAGIQPRKAAAQRAATPSAESKKRKTWVYVTAGFALAFVVLITIGLLLPEEEKVAGTTTGTEQNSQQPEVSTLTHNLEEEPIRTQDNSAAGKTETNNAAETVTGRWKEVDEGITSTFVLQQNGSAIHVQVEMNGQIVSTGTGTIKNKNVELNFPLFGFPTMLIGTLSEDNNTLNGNFIVQATGDEQPIQLVRRTK